MLDGYFSASVPEVAKNEGESFVRGSHEDLRAARRVCCSICGTARDADVRADHWSQGALLWMRGGQVEHEDVPLCAACTAAVGMTVLTRRAIEEEEEG